MEKSFEMRQACVIMKNERMKEWTYIRINRKTAAFCIW